MTKFKIGDMVKVVNYGHRLLMGPDMQLQGYPYKWDMRPEVVGQTGIVTTAEETQGRSQYVVEGPSKHAWYDDDQLELVYRPDYPELAE